MLSRINKDLRQELKWISDISTILCDELQRKQDTKERTIHKADEDTVLKMRDKEMKNLMNEYETLKKMSDYNYAIDLKAQLKESMDTVRLNNKLIKDLEAKQ